MGNEKELLSNIFGLLVVFAFTFVITIGVPYFIYVTIPWLFWTLAGIYGFSILSIPVIILDSKFNHIK
ncbi:MAG: hypothetical protein U5L75_00420 [Candidatus Campbellbacteria bacterium]|nr:hypothetical protein [Candidatus Campbellbacteria bacterium]